MSTHMSKALIQVDNVQRVSIALTDTVLRRLRLAARARMAHQVGYVPIGRIICELVEQSSLPDVGADEEPAPPAASNNHKRGNPKAKRK